MKSSEIKGPSPRPRPASRFSLLVLLCTQVTDTLSQTSLCAKHDFWAHSAFISH